jgi:hypothetical protein
MASLSAKTERTDERCARRDVTPERQVCGFSLWLAVVLMLVQNCSGLDRHYRARHRCFVQSLGSHFLTRHALVVLARVHQ